jgi:hypothetical protein
VIQLLPAWFANHMPYTGKPAESPVSIGKSVLRNESSEV